MRVWQALIRGASDSQLQKSVTAAVVTSLMIAGICMLTSSCATGSEDAQEPTLKEAYKSDFLIGVAINRAQIYGEDSPAMPIIKTQFNCISPENVLKWEFVHPQPDTFDFAASDRYVKFGQKNHMTIIGHTLVWHNQIPGWAFTNANGTLLDREALLNRMSNHIHTVVGRYKGRIKGWDVVNEAVDDDGSLRQTPWMKIIGKDYIEKAFQFAHEADPDAELYYNDFGLENEAKRQGAIAIVKNLQSKGIKISGVGLQGHYSLEKPNLKEVDETISDMSSLGIKVMITELDVNVLPQPLKTVTADISQRVAGGRELDPYTNGLPAAVQEELVRRYSGLFSVFLKHRDCVTRVTLWGLSDGDSWLNDWSVRGRTSYPLLFDRNHSPKPAFRAIIKTALDFHALPAQKQNEVAQKSSSQSDSSARTKVSE